MLPFFSTVRRRVAVKNVRTKSNCSKSAKIHTIILSMEFDFLNQGEHFVSKESKSYFSFDTIETVLCN